LEGVKVRAHVFFEGLVQGVFFRAHTKKCADALMLTGWVRNTHDGRVEAVFEGEEEKVHEAIEWCASKQPHAKVDKKEVELSEAKGEFEDFMIRY
jgi:acylphosphatase